MIPVAITSTAKYQRLCKRENINRKIVIYWALKMLKKKMLDQT